MARLALLASVLLVASSAAEADDISQARELVREARTICGESCEILSQFGTAQAKVGDVQESKRTFADLWNTAARLEDGVERRMVLHGVATLQAQAGQVTDAIENSLRLHSRYERAMTLGWIAVEQAETGQAQAALLTVDLMPEEETWQRNATRQMIAMALSEQRDFVGANRVLESIPGDVEEAVKILSSNEPGELSQQEHAVVDPVLAKITGLIVVAQNQAEAGDLRAALQTAHSIRLERFCDIALQRVARIAADSDDLTVATEAIDGIRDQERREVSLVRVVAALARLGRVKEASRIVETIQDPTQSVEVIVEMAAAHAARGSAQLARSLFERASDLIGTDEEAKNAASSRIADACVRSGQLQLAEQFAGEINHSVLLSEAFQSIASANSRMGKTADTRRLFERSRRTADTVADPPAKCARLQELAVAQYEAGDRQGGLTSIRAAAEAARQIEIGGGTDVILLTKTATTQFSIGDREGAANTFQSARAAAARYPDGTYVAQLLQDVSAAQADVGEIEAALQAARGQKSALIRSSMLLGVANGILSRSELHPTDSGQSCR